MKRTTITLPDELAELVAYEAERRDSTVSEVIRLALTGALLEKRRKVPFAAVCDDPSMIRGSEMEDALEGFGDDLDRNR